MKRVLIFGGLGEATAIGAAIIDASKRGSTEYELAGYLNDISIGETMDGYPVLGGRKDIPRFIEEGYYFLNTVYKVDHQQERQRVFEGLNIPEDRLAIFVHPMAYVSPNVILSPGCVVMPGVTISSSTTFGICCRIMSGAFIGHDTVVGSHVFFAANSCVGSNSIVEDWVYFGFNCTAKGQLRFGKFSVVGMGAVVVKSVEPFHIVKGNPAVFHRYVRDKPAVAALPGMA
jgi:sugar O-acyltransferase (sialic acid O-acetyltransferase NeuD family)